MLIPYDDSSWIIQYRMASENAFRGFVRCPNCSFTVTRFGDVSFRECNKCNTTFLDNCKTLSSLDDVEEIFSNLTSDFEESSHGKSSLHGSQNSPLSRQTAKSLDVGNDGDISNWTSDNMGSLTQESSHGRSWHGSQNFPESRRTTKSLDVSDDGNLSDWTSGYMGSPTQENSHERPLHGRPNIPASRITTKPWNAPHNRKIGSCTSDYMGSPTQESSHGGSSLHGSENSSVTRHTTKSLDVADYENFTNRGSDFMGSPTQGSSHGTPLLHGSKKIVSKRTQRPSGFINAKVEKVEACSLYSEMSACSQEQLQERTIASRSSSRNSSMCTFKREMSVDYDDVLSEYNSIESEMDASFRSELSRNTFRDIPTVTPSNPQSNVRPDRLRNPEPDLDEPSPKVYEKNCGLAGSYTSYRSTERTLLSTNQEAEPEKDIFHSHSTIPNYPNEVPWRSRRTLAKDSRLLKPIFPAETVYCCLHCEPECCQSSVPYSQRICCSNGMSKTCRNSCCRTSIDTKCHSASKPLRRHINHNHHDKEKLDLQQKQESSKCCYKPVLGGINFMMCYKCFFVLQMPLPFQFSRKKPNKLRCGKCQQVLLYSVIDGTHIVPREYSPGEN